MATATAQNQKQFISPEHLNPQEFERVGRFAIAVAFAVALIIDCAGGG